MIVAHVGQLCNNRLSCPLGILTPAGLLEHTTAEPGAQHIAALLPVRSSN